MGLELDLKSTREEYDATGIPLLRGDEDWREVFQEWYGAATTQEVNCPNAMTLGTIDEDGQPWLRVVLLKALDSRGFTFFTNTDSPKAQQLAKQPRATLHFYWKSLQRQVQIRGKVMTLPKSEAHQYFLTRPEESQMSSWISQQSQPIAGRHVLYDALEKIRATGAPAGESPEHWGGYALVPSEIEFWQGASHRLHHRVVITLTSELIACQRKILSP